MRNAPSVPPLCRPICYRAENPKIWAIEAARIAHDLDLATSRLAELHLGPVCARVSRSALPARVRTPRRRLSPPWRRGPNRDAHRVAQRRGAGDVGNRRRDSRPGVHPVFDSPPLHQWTPSIAPSGTAFYGGDEFPGRRGSLLAGAGHPVVRTLNLDRLAGHREERRGAGVRGSARSTPGRRRNSTGPRAAPLRADTGPPPAL